MADPGEPPLIFRSNWGPKGGKKILWRHPPPLISRSGSGNGLFGRHYTWILIIASKERNALHSPLPPTSAVFSVIQFLSLPARSRSWSPRSYRKQERDRLVRKTTPLLERNELTPSVKETKCNFRRTSPAPISEKDDQCSLI